MNATIEKIGHVPGTNKKLVTCVIYSKTQPATLPTTGAGIDGLDSDCVFDVGSVLLVVSTNKKYLWCNDLDQWQELGSST